MRLPRVRFTVRRMMVAVAVVAVAALIQGGEFLRRRSHDYAARADNYAVELTLGGAEEPWPPITAEEIISEQRKAERLRYYSAMEQKYRHAARRPWLPVEPDPPPP